MLECFPHLSIKERSFNHDVGLVVPETLDGKAKIRLLAVDVVAVVVF